MPYVSAKEFLEQRKKKEQSEPAFQPKTGYVSAKEFLEQRKRVEPPKTPFQQARESGMFPLDLERTPTMQAVRAFQAQQEQQPQQERQLPFLARIQQQAYERFIEPVTSAAWRVASNIADPFGLTRRIAEQKGVDLRESPILSGFAPPETTAERVQDIVGQVVGSLAPGAAAYRTGGRLAASLARNAPRVAQEAARGAGAGAAFGGMREALESAVGIEESAAQRARDIGLDVALGGIGDPLVSTIGRALTPAVRRGLEAIRGRQTEQPLALPAPRTEEPVPALSEAITPEPPQVQTGQRGRLADILDRVTETVREAGERITGGRVQGLIPFRRAPEMGTIPTETKQQLRTRLKREPTTLSEKATQAYIDWTDDVFRLNQFERFAEEVQKRTLTREERPYELALASRGADVIARQIATNALVDSRGNVVGKSLKEILRPLSNLPRGAYLDFQDYLLNRHALTRAARGERVFDKKIGWTPERGEEIVATYEAQFPEFRQMADELYNFQREMVNRWLVDTGLVSRETAEQWFQQNPYYIPNKRYFSELEKASGGKTRVKKGFADQSAPVKKYSPTGSERPVIQPLEAIIENIDAFVKAAKRNEVMQAVIRNIRQDPEAFADWAEIVRVGKRSENIRLNSEGALEEALDDFMRDFDRSMQNIRLDKDNIVRGYVDGQPVYVKINDKMLLDALMSIGPEGQNWILDKVGQLTRVFKVLTTGANPIFALTRNIFRDIPQAYIMSKTTNNPIVFVRDLMAAFFDITRDNQFYQAFKNVGGGHSSSIAADRNLLAQTKRQILPRQPIRAFFPTALNVMENFMNAIESAPRLAEFKRVMKQSGDFTKALYEAQDITTNFKKRGRIAKEVDKVFPYFNAAIQGLDKFAREFIENPAKAFIKAFLALTVPTVVLYAMNRDDPNYQQLSDHIKDNYFLIPKGDGTFIRIAKPRELGTLFSDIPERLLRQFADEDPEAWRRFSDQLRIAFTVPGVEGLLRPGTMTERLMGPFSDMIFGPIFDVSRNQDFAGRPIVPGYMENLPPELQYDERTSELSRILGQLTGTSPRQLDYLIRQYTGFIGQLALPAMAPGASVSDVLDSIMTVNPLYSTDIVNDFYAKRDELEKTYQAFKQTGERPEGFNNALRLYFNRISDSISDIRKQMRALDQNKRLDEAEKDRRRQELQQKIINLARGALQRAQELNQ